MDIPDSGGGQLNKLMASKRPCVRCNTPLAMKLVNIVKNLNKLDNGDPDMVLQTKCESCGKVQILWNW